MGKQDVILVNERDEQVGTMEKMEAHRKGILHRAFSVFIFNRRGEMLLQQRADEKYHSPGLWTNACCSHPYPGEESREASSRRLKEELGFTVSLEELFSFTYRAQFDNGLTEHEYDHVFAGIYEGPVHPDRTEVKDYAFLPMHDIVMGLNRSPGKYTAWFRIAYPRIQQWWAEKFGTAIANLT